MVTSGTTYDEATNTMTVGAVENCLTSATADPNTHTHAAHIVIQNAEDIIGWQARVNYLGDKMRPNTVNFIPFTDNTTGQNISFNNLPIDQSTFVHRDLITASSIPAAAAGPQTASFGASYIGVQDFAISPDTPAKATPDDSSYSAPSGGLLASVVLQVLAGNAGDPSLFMNLDDGDPNSPGGGIAFFTGSGSQDVLLPPAAFGDGYHGEGATCVALDCTTQECPPASPTPVPTPSPTQSAPPTPVPTPSPTQSAPPTPVPTPSPTPICLPLPSPLPTPCLPPPPG